MEKYPITSHSWTVIGPRLGIKIADKTLVESQQTGLPRELWPHLLPHLHLDNGDKVTWNALSTDNIESPITIEIVTNGRVRLNKLPIDADIKIGDKVAIYFGEGSIKLIKWPTVA